MRKLDDRSKHLAEFILDAIEGYAHHTENEKLTPQEYICVIGMALTRVTVAVAQWDEQPSKEPDAFSRMMIYSIQKQIEPEPNAQ